MLSRLRVIFDDPLFVRTQHGLLPTPRAEALSPALQQLIDDATALVSPEIFDPQASTATVTISTNDYMQSVLTVPLIAKLRQEAPNMRVGVRNLEVAALTDKLARGDIDMAITIPEFTDTTLNTSFLYHEEYVAVVRMEHPIRARRPSLKQFLSYDHVLMSPTEGSFSGPADEAIEALGGTRRVAISVPRPSSFKLTEPTSSRPTSACSMRCRPSARGGRTTIWLSIPDFENSTIFRSECLI